MDGRPLPVTQRISVDYYRNQTHSVAGHEEAAMYHPGSIILSGRVADPKAAEASSVAAKHGPKPAAQADLRCSASSRTDRQTASRRQPAATPTGSKAGDYWITESGGQQPVYIFINA